MISYDQFSALDIRLGRITAVERVPETDKLLQFTIDFGDHQRTIIGGWAVSYPDPTLLVNTQVPVLVNLEPRTIRGITSEGMILSVVEENQPIALHPDREVTLGAPIR